MFIRLLTVIVTFALALFFIHLGLEHMAGEVGLTPYLAFLFAGISAIAPAIMYERMIQVVEDRLDILHETMEIQDRLNIVNDKLINLYQTAATKSECDVETDPILIDFTELERKHFSDPDNKTHDPALCNEAWCIQCDALTNNNGSLIKETGIICQDPPFTCTPPWCDYCNSKGERNAKDIKECQAQPHV